MVAASGKGTSTEPGSLFSGEVSGSVYALFSVLLCGCVVILAVWQCSPLAVINKLNRICTSLFAILWLAPCLGSHVIAGSSSGTYFMAVWLS